MKFPLAVAICFVFGYYNPRMKFLKVLQKYKKVKKYIKKYIGGREDKIFEVG